MKGNNNVIPEGITERVNIFIGIVSPVPAGRDRIQRRVFTLIELLVVIAVISVLMTLLLPALKNAKELALRKSCMNNLRQYSFGLFTFSGDYDGYFPGIINHGQGESGVCMYQGTDYPNVKPWMYPYRETLQEYIPAEITLCPGAPSRPSPWMPYGDEGCEWWQSSFLATRLTWQQDATTKGWWKRTDYQLRAGFGGAHGGVTDDDYDTTNCGFYRGLLESAIFPRRNKGFVLNYRVNQKDSHEMNPLILDRSRSMNDDGQDGAPYRLLRSNHALRSGSPAAAGGNALMRDGHVRWMNLAPLWNREGYPTWSSNYLGTLGYAEGGYRTYVDDEIAEFFN